MKDPLYEQKVKAQILVNRAIDNALAEAEPVLKAFAESRLKIIATHGPSALAHFNPPPPPEYPAEKQQLLEVLAEVRRKRETK
jgi:hypothetical protein